MTQRDQRGFTLIELVVVLVILAILSATASRKYAGLASDARTASLKAAKGSLRSASQLAHAYSLLDPGASSLTLEGVTVNLVYGYPAALNAADAGKLAELAGLGAGDYELDTSKGELTVRPRGLNPASAGRCSVTYVAPTRAGQEPQITYGSTVPDCT